jgi:hypothetical protein
VSAVSWLRTHSKQIIKCKLLVSGFLILLLFMSGFNVNLLRLLRRYITEDVACSVILIVNSNGILFSGILEKLKPAGLISPNHKFLPYNESKWPEHP